MKRYLLSLALLCLVATGAQSFWQSRQQVAISAGGGAYVGPGDVYGTAVVWWGLRAFSVADKGNRLINICDPANVTCADWSSSATTGLLVAGTNPLNGTDCTVSTTCTINIAYDRSGSTNCTTAIACDVHQNTAANRPTFNWNAGNPYMVCSGTQALTTFASSLTSAVSDPLSVSWVAMRTSGAALSAAIGLGNRQFSVGYTATANTLDMFNNVADVPFTAADNAYHAVQNVFVNPGTSSTWFVDGAGPTTVSTSPGTVGLPSGAFFSVCNDDGNSIALTGRFREGGIWSGAVSSGNQATVNTQQRSVWGF